MSIYFTITLFLSHPFTFNKFIGKDFNFLPSQKILLGFNDFLMLIHNNQQIRSVTFITKLLCRLLPSRSALLKVTINNLLVTLLLSVLV